MSGPYFKSSQDARQLLGEHVLFGKINVYTMAPLPEYVDLDYVLEVIEDTVPSMFFHNVDSIFIGEFKEFSERSVNAFYADGAIFVTNSQDSDEDLLDDIVHEVAHAVEKVYPQYFYDESLEHEFLSKRKKLWHRLKAEDIDLHQKQGVERFMDPAYSKEFDHFLYLEIGYPILTSLTFDLFNSPYAITSLQEYWANGFEAFYTGDALRIKSLSPEIYKKIAALVELN